MSEKLEFLNVQGTDGVIKNLNVSAFKGMSKTKFDKKYKNRIVDLDKTFSELEKLNKGGSKK